MKWAKWTWEFAVLIVGTPFFTLGYTLGYFLGVTEKGFRYGQRNGRKDW